MSNYLSCSQINCLFRCPREWVYKYILKYKDVPTDALRIGRVFHSLCEGKSIDDAFLAKEGLDLSFPWKPYLKTMYAGYMVVRDSLWKNYATEFVFENRVIKLITDEIVTDDDGNWKILERKTAGRRDDNKPAMLTGDLQVNLYTAYKDQIAEELWLDPSKFQGVDYLISLKHMERRKKTESVEEFSERFTSETDYHYVPKEVLNPDGAMNVMDFAHRIRSEIKETYATKPEARLIPCNTQSCIRFGKPCPFFKECYK